MEKIFWTFSALLSLGNNPVIPEMPADEAKKPNIIILMADDLGWGDLGFNGSRIKTPNLDRLSEEGIRLSRFYVAPVSSPTRAGLLTGMYPNRFGIRETVIPPWRDFGLEPENIIIPEFLEKQGYRNRAIIGKWHLGHSRQKYYPMNNGFTHFYGHLNGAIDYFTHERDGELDWHNDFASCYDKGYSTDLIAEESVECIKNYTKEGPFFVYVAFNAPHTPLQAKKEDLMLYGYDESKPDFSKRPLRESTGQGNTRQQTYSAMVTCMDRAIGRILGTLRELKIENNTLVIFLSDNGADEGSGGGSAGPLNGHKFLEYDGGVRAPAIVKWPARLKGGKTIDQLTGFVDIFPTICDVVAPGAGNPSAFDGISILNVLEGKKKPSARTFYLGCGAMIENEWKIIRAGQNPQMKIGKDLLYNIVADPFEQNDLSDKYPEIKDNLMRKIVKYDDIKPEKEVLPFNVGREGFVAPKEWNIFLKKDTIDKPLVYFDNLSGMVKDCADPFILNHEGTYYLYGTGGTKGFRVYMSADLAHWSGPVGAKNGYALDSSDVWGQNTFWAPEVYHLNGRFYMFYTAMSHLAIAESDSPLGPFIQKIKKPLHPDIPEIDPHLFIDTDEKMYLYFVRFNKSNEIWMAEMKADLSGIKEGTLKKCISVSEPWEMSQKPPVANIAEGPFMLLHNGFYYLFYSANHFRSQDYAVGYAVAKSPSGPFVKYENNPVLIGDGKNIFGTGHHSFFRSNSGQMYIVYHSHKNGKNVLPRTTCLDLCGFEKDDQDKPDKFVVYGPTVTPQEVR